MITKENIEGEILRIIKNLENKDSISPNADFIKDLNLDSLDVVEIIMEIEKDFKITITDEEAEKINTVQDAVNLVATKFSGSDKINI